MTTLYRQRTAFEKQILAELSTRLKKTTWKKRGFAVFNQTGKFFQDVSIAVHRNAMLTVAELRFKPMALDPILWDILGMQENYLQPLSFRALGAFTCPSLPIYEAQIEQFGDTPAAVADKLVSLCEDNSLLCTDMLSKSSFSSLVAAHPKQSERGAYAITLVASLIDDGDFALAHRTAEAYASGALSSSARMSSGGKEFHQLALEWLEAKERA